MGSIPTLATLLPLFDAAPVDGVRGQPSLRRSSQDGSNTSDFIYYTHVIIIIINVAIPRRKIRSKTAQDLSIGVHKRGEHTGRDYEEKRIEFETRGVDRWNGDGNGYPINGR